MGTRIGGPAPATVVPGWNNGPWFFDRDTRKGGQVGQSRRSLLRAGATLAVAGGIGVAAGCTSGPSTPAPPDPVTVALTALLKSEQALVAGYDAAISAHSQLGGRISGVRADHAAHVKALTALLARREPDASPSPSTAPAPADNSLSSGSSSSARQQLATLERQQATAAITGCLAASGDEAALLASLAASEMTHVEVLT
jgi:hypothetical protein